MSTVQVASKLSSALVFILIDMFVCVGIDNESSVYVVVALW